MESITLDPVIPELSPSLYWALDARNTANDLTVNNRDGTAAGGVTFGGLTDAPPGLVGSTDFDGADDRVMSAYNPFANGSVRTFAGWAKRDTSASIDTLFGGSVAASPQLRLDSGGNNVSFRVNRVSDAGVVWTAAWPGNTVWVHWALVFDEGANNVSLYVNGVFVSTLTDSVAYNASPGTFELGAHTGGGTDQFDGKMAHVAVYERGLNAGEIGALYQRGASQSMKRNELDLHPESGESSIRVRFEGINWGESAIEAFMAKQSRGSTVVDYDVPNRIVTLPLVIYPTDSVSYHDARRQLQAKVALVPDMGMRLRRTLKSGKRLYLDVVNATLKLGGSTAAAWEQADVDAELVLEALPDFWGDEKELDRLVETTEAELLDVLKAGGSQAAIEGDYPGRCRLEIENLAAFNQRGLISCFRSRNYSADATAQMAYEANALSPLDVAASQARTGASGGTTIRHGNIASVIWTPVLSTDAVTSGAKMTHRGTYRVLARVYTTSTTEVRVRFVWDRGDLVVPTENPEQVVRNVNHLSIVDLGEVRLPALPTGRHTWEGQVQARGHDGGENIEIDKLWIVAVDEWMSICKSLPLTADIILLSHAARDEFNQTSGALTGKVAPAGGTWAGAGDADDFTINTATRTARRTAVSDVSDVFNGRWALAGVTVYSTIGVGVAMKHTSTPAGGRRGVFARYVDRDNNIYVAVSPTSSAFRVWKRVAGVETTLKEKTIKSLANVWHAVGLAVNSSGQWWGYYVSESQGKLTYAVLAGHDVDLATGGVLDDGRIGMMDHHTSSTANTRDFDNFSSVVAFEDAVIYENGKARLGTDGLLREADDGSAYGPISINTGFLPRIPVSGPEERAVELLVKTSRGDMGEESLLNVGDTGIDDLAVRPFYNPSWLFDPE